MVYVTINNKLLYPLMQCPSLKRIAQAVCGHFSEFLEIAAQSFGVHLLSVTHVENVFASISCFYLSELFCDASW